MASIYDLKPKFQALLRPVTRRLAAAGVTANHVTLLALALSVALGALLAWRPGAHRIFLLVPVWLFVRMALNAVDGMLAREHDMKTNLGAILNELGDVVSDAALYLPFALVQPIRPWLAVAVTLLAVLTEMAGVAAVQIGATRRYDGPMGKSDRAFVFGLLGLLIGLGVRPGLWANVLLGVVAALLILTVANRARRALAEAKPQ